MLQAARTFHTWQSSRVSLEYRKWRQTGRVITNPTNHDEVHGTCKMTLFGTLSRCTKVFQMVGKLTIRECQMIMTWHGMTWGVLWSKPARFYCHILRLRRNTHRHNYASFDNLLSHAGLGHPGKCWIVRGTTTRSLPYRANGLFYPSWNRLYLFTTYW